MDFNNMNPETKMAMDLTMALARHLGVDPKDLVKSLTDTQSAHAYAARMLEALVARQSERMMEMLGLNGKIETSVIKEETKKKKK